MKLGDSLAVIGVGPIGLLAIQCLHLAGPGRLIEIRRVNGEAMISRGGLLAEIQSAFTALTYPSDDLHVIVKT